MTKSPSIRIIELHRGKPIAAVLREMAERGLDYDEMGAELGVCAMTVRRWATALGARRSIVIPEEPASVS